MKIAILGGGGYVGLVTGATFSELGNVVYLFDVDQRKISLLKTGKVPIHEPGLEEIVRYGLEQKKLIPTSDAEEAIRNTEIGFITVGTPPGVDGAADLQYVLSAADTVIRMAQDNYVLVIKSTVPPGTADLIQKRLNGKKIHIASNPEFLKEGKAVEDAKTPERIVIGVTSKYAEQVLNNLYKAVTAHNRPIFVMTPTEAELTKYASNSLLATKISSFNELANICDVASANFSKVRDAVCADSRIGKAFSHAGPGYGGSCFPKDIPALVQYARSKGYDPKLLQETHETNERQKQVIFNKLKSHFGMLKGKRIAVWGIAFKPDTDDIREAPSIPLINSLIDEGAQVAAYDPFAMQNAKKLFGGKIEYASTPEDAAKGADAICLLTEWKQLRSPDWNFLKGIMRSHVIIDGRNIYDDLELLRSKGFTYFGIGRR